MRIFLMFYSFLLVFFNICTIPSSFLLNILKAKTEITYVAPATIIAIIVVILDDIILFIFINIVYDITLINITATIGFTINLLILNSNFIYFLNINMLIMVDVI